MLKASFLMLKTTLTLRGRFYVFLVGYTPYFIRLMRFKTRFLMLKASFLMLKTTLNIDKSLLIHKLG